MRYAQFVAELIEKGQTNIQILSAVINADSSGLVRIPFKKWSALDRVNLMMANANMATRKAIQIEFDETPSYLFFDEPKWVRHFRQILQTEDRSFTT